MRLPTAASSLALILGLQAGACRPPAPPPPAAPETGYVGETVREPGVLVGRVSYSGPEVDRAVVVGRDPLACGPLGSELKEGSLLVDGSDGLAGAIVMVEGVRRGRPVEPRERSLVNVRCLFEPRVQVASVGDSLAVGSRDPALHSTRVRLDGRTLFNLTLPEPGSRIVKPLKEPGLLEVGCDAHDWMRAFVWVGEGPYLAVTGVDGTFRIEGLPPGEHALLVWHERLGTRRLRVTLRPNAQADVAVSY